MAQAIQVIPTNESQPLNPGSFADIPGLSITILNGSGWIRATSNLCCHNLDPTTDYAACRITVDGAQIPNSQRGSHIPQNLEYTFGGTFLIKPGAGQHTYKLQGLAVLGTAYINLYLANFIIEEPGF
jgi:hypothetical protein